MDSPYVAELRAAHAAFWLSPQTVALAVIGPGKVGAALLDQLQAALPRLRSEANIDLRLRALATSSKLWLAMRRARGTRRWRRAWKISRKKLSGLTDAGRFTGLGSS